MNNVIDTFHVFTDYEKCITSASIEMESLKTIPSTLSRLCTASNSFVVSSSSSSLPSPLSPSSLSALSSLFNYSPTLCVCVSASQFVRYNELHTSQSVASEKFVDDSCPD